MRRFVRFTAISIIILLFVISFSGVQSASCFFDEDALVTGPYVDEVIFKIIPHPDQRYLALQSGDIVLDMNFINPVHFLTIPESDIDVFTAIRNSYGHLTINCRDYPLNISGLRRAFAYAYDKTAVTVEAFDGFSIEHDSLVPQPNGWCIEDELDWDYYTNRSDIGNQILDELGFVINATTGFRNAPNGEPFDILIEHVIPEDVEAIVCEIGVEALQSLHINASRDIWYTGELNRLEAHGNYDMVFYETEFYDSDIDWLAYEYWSDNADVFGENLANFENDTYDSWRDQLLFGSTYEEVHEAASEMQKILHYNVPRLVVYENTYIQGYRSDQFIGQVEDLSRYISGPWTLRKIHKLDGTFGGSVPIAINEDPDTFNIFTAKPVSLSQARNLLQQAIRTSHSH
ncbi:MAG: ABC transporter substrate-binding protein, partial [Candidatus Thorarchaeota archaeon]